MVFGLDANIFAGTEIVCQNTPVLKVLSPKREITYI